MWSYWFAARFASRGQPRIFSTVRGRLKPPLSCAAISSFDLLKGALDGLLFIAGVGGVRHHRRLRAWDRGGSIDRRGIDHLDRGFRTVRLSVADLQGQDRH